MKRNIDYSRLSESDKNALRNIYIVLFVGRKDLATGTINFNRMTYKVSTDKNDLIIDPENPNDNLISFKHKVYKRTHDMFGRECTLYIEDTTNGRINSFALHYEPNVYDNAKDLEIKITNNESIIVRYGIFAMDPHNDEDVLKIARANGVDVAKFLDEEEKTNITLER